MCCPHRLMVETSSPTIFLIALERLRCGSFLSVNGVAGSLPIASEIKVFLQKLWTTSSYVLAKSSCSMMSDSHVNGLPHALNTVHVGKVSSVKNYVTKGSPLPLLTRHSRAFPQNWRRIVHGGFSPENYERSIRIASATVRSTANNSAVFS